MWLLQGAAVTPQERDCGLVEVPPGLGSGTVQGEVGHRACKMSPGDLAFLFGFFLKEQREREGTERELGKGVDVMATGSSQKQL